MSEPLTARQAVRITIAVVAVVGGALLVWQLRHIVIYSFVAALIASALYLPSHWLERWLPRLAAVLVVYLALVVLIAGLMLVIVPPLVEQANELIERLPRLTAQIERSLADLVRRFAPAAPAAASVNQLSEAVRDALPGIGSVLRATLHVAEVVTTTVLIVFLSALMLLERDRILGWIAQFLSNDRQRQLSTIARDSLTSMGASVRGQLVVMTVIGVGTAAGMFILGVPFVLPLAVLAFLAEAIPIVGPLIAGVPIVILASLVSPLTGVLMAGWMIVLQQLEGYLLTPAVQSRAVRLSPLVILLAIAAGATLAGLIGAIIAIPVATVVHTILQHVVVPDSGRPRRARAS